jgi:hypothetical protein
MTTTVTDDERTATPKRSPIAPVHALGGSRVVAVASGQGRNRLYRCVCGCDAESVAHGASG